MSVFLQMGVGLGAVCVLMWLILILRKKKSVKGFLYAGIMTVACIALVVCELLGIIPKSTDNEAELSQTEIKTFAYALVNYGSYEEARQIMEIYSDQYGYDDECSLMNARIYALQGNYAQASGVYKRLLQNADYAHMIAEESEDVIAKASIDISQLGVINYLNAQGYDLEKYGYSKEQAEKMKAVLRITPESISDKITEAIGDAYEIDEYEDAIACVCEAERVYEAYGAQRFDYLADSAREEIETAKDELEDAMEDYETIACYAYVRDAMLKLKLMLAEYDEIAEAINENATYTELIVVSRLYQKNAVDDSDFEEKYVAEYEKYSKQIYKKLKTLYRAIRGDLNTIEKQNLESTVEIWNVGADYPALMFIKNELENRLEADEVGSEASKAYLELAQIEHFLQNSDGRENCISDALAHGHESEDDDYREAMSKINGVIENTEDITAILNVGSYVRDALNNAIPVETYDLIPKEILENDKVGDNSSDNLRMVSEDSEKGVLQDFESAFTDDVSKMMSSMSISSVDTTNFETIEAYFSVSSDFATNSEELKAILSVYDCGFEITDFKIEKVECDSVRTHLLCDVSGSMNDSIEDLRNAVISYVNTRSKTEEIAVTSFASDIVSGMDFGATDEELLEYANNMHSGGGTAIVASALHVLENFATTRNGKHVLIVMTDGQDGGYYSTYDIMNYIRPLAEKKNITVHTIGLGSVDLNYLNAIAAGGDGMCVYVSDSGSLEGFYELLHGQVDNQYKVTFKAQDTMTLMHRTLEMKLKDTTVHDTFTYSIGTDESKDGGKQDGEQEETPLDVSTLSVTGLKTRFIYKGKEDVENALLGTGFTQGSLATLTLKGDNEYFIPMEYESETQYNLMIPAKVEEGMYDLIVSIGGKKAVLVDGLIVEKQDDLKAVTFGPYSFTASKKSLWNDTYYLSGNVVMNGWLRFKGEVKITGDLVDGLSVVVEDYSGSYVMFDDAAATGLGAYFASKDIFVEVPALGKFELIYDDNNLYDYEQYAVEDIYTLPMRILQIAQYDSLVLNLYPDRLELLYKEFNTELPGLDDIFDTSDKKIFKIEGEGKGILNSQNIGIDFESEAEFNAKEFCKVNMMNAPVLINKAGVQAKINTWAEEYEFAAEVDLAVVDFGVGASVGFSKRDVDKFSVTVDKPVTVTMGGVPVTFSAFTLGAENISAAVKHKKFSDLTIKGGMKISAYEISALCPPMKEFVGDVSLLSLDETEFELDLQPIMFKAATELKLLEKVTLAKTELQVGTFEYSNAMLEMPPDEVSGMRASLTRGFMLDLDNFNVNLSATGEIDALSRFFGVQMNGTASITANWYWCPPEIKKEGDVLLGLHHRADGVNEFVIVVEYMEEHWFSEDTKERLKFYIDENGNSSTSFGGEFS